MSKKPVRVVPVPEDKPIAEMTDEEIEQLAADLVRGDMFAGIPGTPETPPTE